MRVNDKLAIVGSLQFGISGPLDCHVYAVRGSEGLVLIDAGAGTHSQQLLRNIDCDFPGCNVEAAILTHAHGDHCGGIAQIRRLTNCKVIAPESCKRTLETGDEELSGLRVAREQGLYPPEFRFQTCPIDITVRDGERFTAAGIEFTAIHVRGHSEDAHCYLMTHEGLNWLFTGDVLFYGGVLGVINAEGSGLRGYRSDLWKLTGLKVDGLFPGHGMFTVRDGQRHIDCAIEQLRKGFVSRQIGQGDLIF